MVVENKARVFKVIKTPVDMEDVLLPVMQNVLGYEFFTLEDGTPLELRSGLRREVCPGLQVGDSYGAVPDGASHKSATVLQNELAVQRSKSGMLQRVIWLREGAGSAHAQQHTEA